MMIHLEDAEAAFTAVMCSRWLPRLLASTFLTVLILSIFTLERSDHALRNSARVSKCCSKMAQVSHQAKSIECEKVEESSHSQWDPLDKLLVYQRLFVPVKYVRSIANILSIDN